MELKAIAPALKYPTPLTSTGVCQQYPTTIYGAYAEGAYNLLYNKHKDDKVFAVFGR